MPTPKQSGQPSGGMFQKYTGEQINQIPEGYVQGMGAMGQAYQSIGQSIGNAAASIGKMAGEAKASEAKIKGTLAPYLVNTTKEITAGLQNGNLIKDASGQVVPNEAKGITAGMVDTTKLDFYNKTGGDINKLAGTELTQFAASFESAQAMAKVEAERSTTALKNAKISAEINKLNADAEQINAANAFMKSYQGVGSAGVEPNLGLANGAQPTLQGTTPTKEAPAVKEPGSNTAFANNNIKSTGASVNTAATTPADTNAPTPAKADSYARKAPTQADQLRQEISSLETDLAAVEDNAGNETVTATAAKARTIQEKIKEKKALLNNVNESNVGDLEYYFNQDEPSGATAAAKPTVNPATIPAPGTPAASAATQSKKAPPPATAAQTNVAGSSVVPQAAPTQPARPSEAEQLVTLGNKRSALVAQKDEAMQKLQREIIGRKMQLTKAATNPRLQEWAKLEMSFVDNNYKIAEDQWDAKIKGVDAEITNVKNVADAQRSVTAETRAAAKAAQEVKNADIAQVELEMKQAKAKSDVLTEKEQHTAKFQDVGYFVSNWRGLSRDQAVELGVSGNSPAAINDIKDSFQGYVKAQKFLITLDTALDNRERGDGGLNYLSRFKITTGNKENWATAQLADIFGVATFRRAIVSGGNFSDSDRLFVQKAIAYLNSIDPTETPEVQKAKVKVLARFVNSMFVDGMSAYDYNVSGQVVEAKAAKLREMAASEPDKLKAASFLRSADQITKDYDEHKAYNRRFDFEDGGERLSPEEIHAVRSEIWSWLNDGTSGAKGAAKVPDTYEQEETDGSKTTMDINRSNPSKFIVKPKKQ
jgi:hypothetical protein